MKISQIQLKNFRRFTDLRITGLAHSVKLVVLAGPNGSGKSSLFDAFLAWHRFHTVGSTWDADYHNKQMPGAGALPWNQAITLSYHNDGVTADRTKKAIYVRSAYRNEPEFRSDNLQSVQPATQETRFHRLIENDQAVSANYRRLISQGFADLFAPENSERMVRDFTEQLIGEIRDAMQRLFPDLRLNSLGNPLAGASFRFDKGESKAFLYKNLSGGEKAAFDLLLDLLVKRREFDDTVFLIDEPEAHMAASVQGKLLSEMLRIVPDNSQLWLATHSLGMIRRAMEIERDGTGAVAFLDFEGQDFDVPTVLAPIASSRPFWRRAAQIALDDLAGHLAPERVFLCEGGGASTGTEFDAACYNEIFKVFAPNAIFIGSGDGLSVATDKASAGRIIASMSPETKVWRLIDRDDRSDDEIRELSGRGTRVLTMRTIESYLLHDSVLTVVCKNLGRPEFAAKLLEAKATALAGSVAAGGPKDNFKRVAGDVYLAIKQLFPDRKFGNDKRSFMKGFCAPAVRESEVFQLLRDDIFGK